MDRLEEWRLFVSVAGLGSFAKAARALGKSPQAATRGIAALEERLGTRLLHRTTRSVSLTAEGRGFLERGRRVLADFDQLEQTSDEKAPLRGTVSVSASVLFGQLHVAPVVCELLRQHVEVDARLVLLDRFVSLAEESIDVAVRIGKLPDSSLRARQLGHVRSVVCASPSYLERAGVPRSPDALAKHSCIAFTATTPLPERWAFPGARGRERSVAARARLTVNTGQAAIDAALSGVGLVRVFSYQVGPLVASNKLRIVLSRFEPEPAPVHLVQLPGAASRAASAFVDLATTRLRAKLADSP